ncbi:hypothetical protein Pfo_020017 [Paulownia fortunei]|nr:hypothetical protein Pfo_020017 [Paulownia fortunei]
MAKSIIATDLIELSHAAAEDYQPNSFATCYKNCLANCRRGFVCIGVCNRHCKGQSGDSAHLRRLPPPPTTNFMAVKVVES